MTQTRALHAALTALAPVGLLFFSACAVPLGPGYHVDRQSLDVRYVMSSPPRPEVSGPRLRVRAIFQLRNSGTHDLAFLEVELPDQERYGRQNLRVQLDDHPVTPRTAADGRPGTTQIPFDPPWPQRQRRSLVIEYDLASTPPGHALLAVNEESFHLREFGWFPKLRAPKELFAEGGERPEEIRVRIEVPEGFRAIASGQALGSRRRQGEIEYRFRLRQNDFDPFVVAGRYHEQRGETGDGTVILWTFRPVNPEEAQRAETRIAATVRTYRSVFGPISKKPRPVYLVETPARLGQGPAGNGFPEGALINREAFAAGITSDSFLHLAEHELAHTWFGNRLTARPEAEVVLGEALPDYATLVAAEARGREVVRRHHVALLLRRYDAARKLAAEKPLAALPAGVSGELRAIAENKGALFFLALEDQCGKQNVRRALARLVHSLRGSSAGFAELRSALELETHQNLAEFFRAWLNETGIPAEFRARYAEKPEDAR